MASSDSDSDSDQGEQIRVSFKLASSVTDRSLEVPTEAIAVPSDIGRKGLSAVINHLLGRKVAGSGSDSDDNDDNDNEQTNAIPFEFILKGRNMLLRKGIEKEARQYGVSLEQAIEIIYFPAAIQPESVSSQVKLPDWISSVSICHSKIFVGCYDGSVHVYDNDNNDQNTNPNIQQTNAQSIASGPVKCIDTKSIYGSGANANNSNDNTTDRNWIATASLDHTLHIHQFDSKKNEFSLHGTCSREGRSSYVSSICFAKGSNKKDTLATGDADGTVCIWDPNTVAETAVATKRMKGESKARGTSAKIIRPTIVMESAHQQEVSGLTWSNADPNDTKHLVTGSWDHSLKLWDVDRQDCLLTLNGSRVVTCLDSSYHSEGVVATGHPDCTIRLWDMRTSSSSNTKPSSLVVDTTFRPSHKAWVSQVAWSRVNAYHLSSTSYDGTVKLWDIRSTNPLYSVRVFPKEEKGLTFGVSDDRFLFAGGTDCVLKMLKV